MVGLLNGALPDLAVWGTVVPNALTWSIVAREVLMDTPGSGETVPACMPPSWPCSTSMVCALAGAAGMLDGHGRRHWPWSDGVDCLSKISDPA